MKKTILILVSILLIGCEDRIINKNDMQLITEQKITMKTKINMFSEIITIEHDSCEYVIHIILRVVL